MPPLTPRAASGVGIGMVVGANRTRHPLDARTLARLAAQYAGRGVVGFGLANDERRGRAEDFARAFRIARDAGLASVPARRRAARRGERARLPRGPRRRPGRPRHPVGGGPRASCAEVVDRGVTLEVCPASNVGARRLRRAGGRTAARPCSTPVPGWRSAPTTRCSSGPGWPRSTCSRASALACTDEELAALARQSVEGSRAPAEVQGRVCSPAIDAWLDAPAG